MKKNVKILGAAAAALLAVAPVAASAVPAANSVAQADSGSSQAGVTYPNGSKFGFWNETDFVGANNGQTLASFSAANNYGLSLPAGLTFVNKGEVQIVDDQGHVIDPNNTQFALVSKQQYRQLFRTGLNAGFTNEGKIFFVKDASGTKPYKVGPNGTLYNVYGATNFIGSRPSDPENWVHDGNTWVPKNATMGDEAVFNFSRKIDVKNPAAAWKPYFIAQNGATQKQNNLYATPSSFPTNIEDILKQAQHFAKPVYTDNNGTMHNATFTTTPNTIRADLADQGISVVNDSINDSVKSFYVTLHATANGSQSSTGIRLWFNLDANNHLYPVLNYKNGSYNVKVQQGTHNYNQVNSSYFTAAAGTPAALALAEQPQKGFYATNTGNGAQTGYADLAVLANGVNAYVPGVYPVTVQATNPNGYTTKYTFNVYISNPNGTAATIHYVPGYGVNVWTRVANNAVAFDGSTRLLTGTNVTTHETATINGISYTRVTWAGHDGGNYWVQTEYLSDAWKPATPSTNNNGEESMTGVAHVTYNGRGGVRLLNADGKYQNQYVKKGSNWKVFAKKTINGRPMYKLGTENQWIPAEYVSIR